MSQLKNAPLLEVIFEIRWKSDTAEDLNKFEMMLGAIYSELVETFPLIQHLRPDPQLPFNIFINQPTHRFSESAKKNYPLFQLGPGVLSVNTINDEYVWEDFYLVITKVVNGFLNKNNFEKNKEIQISLKYLDLYKMPFDVKDQRSFFKDKFKIDLNFGDGIPRDAQPLFINFETAYMTELGALSFSLKNIQNDVNGKIEKSIIFESGIHRSIKLESFMETFDQWLNKSHRYLADFFRTVTAGKTYESFN